MTTDEAVRICQEWLAHNERQRVRAGELQKLAAMAIAGQRTEAQRRMRQLDDSVTVYDGARLEPAVRALVDLASTTVT